MQRKTWLPYLMLVGVTLIWSTNFIIGKALAEIPPIFLATARFTIAGIVMIPIMWHQRMVPRGRIWRTLLLMGFMGTFLFNPLLYFGLHYTTSINAALVNSLSPLVVGVLSHFWLKEKLRRTQVAGLLVSITGIVWITIQGKLSLLTGLRLNPGDFIVLLSTTVWATYTVLTRKATKTLAPVQATMWSTWIGIFLLIPASFVEQNWLPLPPLHTGIILALIYLGLFPSIVAYFLWNTAISKVGPTQAGIFYNLIPVFNAFLATGFLHESFLPYHWVGSLLIVIGLALAMLPTGNLSQSIKRQPAGRDM